MFDEGKVILSRHLKFCVQLMKAYEADASCIQVVIDSATYLLRINLLLVYLHSWSVYNGFGVSSPDRMLYSAVQSTTWLQCWDRVSYAVRHQNSLKALLFQHMIMGLIAVSNVQSGLETLTTLFSEPLFAVYNLQKGLL